MPLNRKFADNIQHVVVVMLENRSFDSVLGRLYSPNDRPSYHIPQIPRLGDVYFGLEFEDVSRFTNTAVVQGATISQAPAGGVRATNSPGHDPGEEFAHVNKQLFGSDPPSGPPTMKGFLQDYADVSGQGADAVRQIMHGYRPPDMPVLSTLARGYAVSDLWFASVPTQTNANRAYSLAGTSMGLIDNGYYTKEHVTFGFDDDKFDTDTIFNVLSRNGENSWTVFWTQAYPPVLGGGRPYTWNLFPRLSDSQIPNVASHFEGHDNFYSRARAGTLPKFSYIEPQWGGAILDNQWQILGTEYHPPEDVQPGEAFVRSIYQSLASNKDAWAKTLLVILFDEHGGLFDHVQPPSATPPWGQGQAPFPVQYPFNFDRYGVRVPAILVSPWIEQRTVVRSETGVPYDHTSLLSTLLTWLLPNLPPSQWGLGARVNQAPTFDGILNATAPRLDDIFASEKSPVVHDPLSYGDKFRLRAVAQPDGGFVTAADVGVIYNRPTIGLDDPVALEFRLGSGQVKSGDTVQIRTSERFAPVPSNPAGYLAPVNTFLGDWRDAHDCYYYKSSDLDDYKQQQWQVASYSNAPLTYGTYLQIQKPGGASLRPDGQDLKVGSDPYTWAIEPVPSVPPREIHIEAGTHASPDGQLFGVTFSEPFYSPPYVFLSLQAAEYTGTFGNQPSSLWIANGGLRINPGNWGCVVHWIAIGWGPHNASEWALQRGTVNQSTGVLFDANVFDGTPVMGLTLGNYGSNTDNYGHAPRVVTLSPQGAQLDMGNTGCLLNYLAVRRTGRPSPYTALAYGQRDCLSNDHFTLDPFSRLSPSQTLSTTLFLGLENTLAFQGTYGGAPAVFKDRGNSFEVNPGNVATKVHWLIAGWTKTP